MDQTASVPPPETLDGPFAWSANDLDENRIRVAVTSQVSDEMLRFVEHLRGHFLTTIVLNPADYDLKACQEVANTIRRALSTGLGLCLVDKLPVHDMSIEEAKACYWLLSAMVCRPVAQKMDGTMIYDVTDTGKKAIAGSGVRPDKTNDDLTFHNDNAYNANMPDVVGLLCLRPAREGGMSRAMSFETAHNLLTKKAPQVLPRLYQPFWFDRQREHLASEDTTFAAPIFTTDGNSVQARLGLHQVLNAYEMRGENLDAAGKEAISALEDVFAEPDHQIAFSMERGQIQYVNNLAIGHSRTHFIDFDEQEKRRHLVRLWLRDHGDRSYVG